MGRNIAYLPVFYNNGLITAINDAFILDSLGHIKYLKPDTLNPEKNKCHPQVFNASRFGFLA